MKKIFIAGLFLLASPSGFAGTVNEVAFCENAGAKISVIQVVAGFDGNQETSVTIYDANGNNPVSYSNSAAGELYGTFTVSALSSKAGAGKGVIGQGIMLAVDLTVEGTNGALARNGQIEVLKCTGEIPEWAQ